MNPREWFENDKLARPHILRINGSYYLPLRFTLAMIFSLHSGEYGGPIVKDLDADDPEVGAHGPRTLTLANGRVVNNPLFTTRRLAGPVSVSLGLQWLNPHVAPLKDERARHNQNNHFGDQNGEGPGGGRQPSG